MRSEIEKLLKEAHKIESSLKRAKYTSLHKDDVYENWIEKITGLDDTLTQIRLLLLLYEKQLHAPRKDSLWVWKAKTLVLLSERFRQLGWYWHSRRFAMLALMDESRLWSGSVSVNHSSFVQLTLQHALPQSTVRKLAKIAFSASKKDQQILRFPEAMLLKIDESWKGSVIDPLESNQVFLSNAYLAHLIDDLKQIRQSGGRGSSQKAGKAFELICRYLLSILPGVRTAGNVTVSGTNTDFDVLCSWEGNRINFLQECTSYFIAECKCYQDTVPFTYVAKFARILEEVRANFGIIFSLEGISGHDTSSYAGAEQQYLYLNKGIVILDISLSDIESLLKNSNFFELIRDKYESVRVLKAARRRDS